MQHAMTFTAPSSLSYLESLNPEQRLAVETTEGPVLVLSGAGTGKTRVLTTRIVHLIHTKCAFAGQILAVTFTNKAAKEMRDRADKMLSAGLLRSSPLEGEPNRSFSDFGGGNAPQAPTSKFTESYPPPNPKGDLAPPQGGSYGARGEDGVQKTAFPWLGTFHSIGAKMLRRHAELVGLTPQFTILDDDDQQRLLKALLAENNIDHTKFPTRAVQNVIQGWKDRGLTPDKINEKPGNYTLREVGAKLYPLYQARLKALNCCDFGDLLLHMLVVFQAHPEVLRMYAERFRYILVDEYQDTNIVQYLWLRLLAAYHKNLCCVGDDDQSIYGWRGAEVGNILKFEHDYPGAKIIRLERNYRSTSSILKAASGLIANNKTRLGKTLWTEDGECPPIRVKSVWDDNEEARFVGEEIEAFQRDKIRLSEMAVLVRAGYQTRSFEERFLTLGLPYRVIGGLRFYERMEIRDAIAYLRVIHQPHDDLAFERIVNTPKRGIGKATMEQLHTRARADNCSLTVAIAGMIERGELKGKTGVTLQKLLAQFENWRSKLTQLKLEELTDLVLEESGYRAMWQADTSVEAAGRLENIRELVRALSEFPNLGEFLEHVGLVSDGAQTADDDMVNIMSLHAAKGLEFDTVFLTGWEEGLFPSARTMEELGTEGLEEERRLAYVGITRARKHLAISHASNRRIYNQWQAQIPSRFLEEIPPETIEHLDGGPYSRRSSGPAMFQREIDSILGSHETAKPGTREASDAPSSVIRKGTHIFHQKFGNGVVLNVEGDHLQIAFKHAGVKKILAEYVELAG